MEKYQDPQYFEHLFDDKKAVKNIRFQAKRLTPLENKGWVALGSRILPDKRKINAVVYLFEAHSCKHCDCEEEGEEEKYLSDIFHSILLQKSFAFGDTLSLRCSESSTPNVFSIIPIDWDNQQPHEYIQIDNDFQPSQELV